MLEHQGRRDQVGHRREAQGKRYTQVRQQQSGQAQGARCGAGGVDGVGPAGGLADTDPSTLEQMDHQRKGRTH